MVQAFKFRFHHWLLDDFADMMEGTARARFKVDEIGVVTPVPITLWHRIARGYNQSGYLAAALAKRLGAPFAGRILRRVGTPRAQRTLGEEERRQNVEGTFAVRRPALVRGRTVLVVDDIMTTGATLSECAKMLKESGAERVWCISLARSVRD